MKGVNIDSKIKLAPPIDRKNFMRLDSNECEWMLNRKTMISFKKFDKFVIGAYGEEAEVIKSLSKYVKRPVEEILIAPGSERAIDLVIRAFFKKDYKVLVPSPTFFDFYRYLKLIEAKILPVPYKHDAENFYFPFNEVISKLDKTVKGIILCNPNNPLSCVMDEEELESVLKRTHALNIPCIIDEAYFEFYGKTSAPLLDKYPNLVILRTVSKSMGLAGIRFGYVLARPKTIKNLLKLRGEKEMSHFSIFCVAHALHNKKYYDSQIKKFYRIKNLLLNFFKKLNIKTYKTYTNFIVIKVAKDKELIKKLQESKILVKPISRWPSNFRLLRDCIRITVPGKRDLPIFMKKFKAIYKTL